MPCCIALLTDFGLADPYVGQMKAVLAGLAPQATVIDISHAVAPFNIAQGAFYLAASQAHFPADTVFCAVVDPGVGTARRLVLARAHGKLFLAPDNGMLGLVLEQALDAAREREENPRQAVQIWDVTPRACTPGEASSCTFHGRDVFAPLAARLALGEDPASLGPGLTVAELIRHEWSRPRIAGAGVIATVLHCDHFGNAILNLTVQPWLEQMQGWGPILLTLPGGASSRTLELVRTYGELAGQGLGLVAGSQGYLELAVNRGSASAKLGLRTGALVRLAPGS